MSAYGDTFPVKRFSGKITGEGYIYPKVVDFGECRYIKSIISQGISYRYCIYNADLRAVVFGQATDSLECSFAGTAINEIDFLNISYLSQPYEYRSDLKGMFENCSELHTVKLGDNLTYIPRQTFANSGVEKINLDKVSRIDMAAFSGTLLSEVTLESIDTLGAHVFDGCERLVSVNLNVDATAVNATAFNNTPIKSLDFHNTEVTGLPSNHYFNLEEESVMGGLPELESIKGTGVIYMPFVNPGMKMDIPNIKGIRAKQSYDFSIVDRDSLRQICLIDSRSDTIEIPATTLNGYVDYSNVDNNNAYFDAWVAIKAERSVADVVTLDPANVSFTIKDDLLLCLPMTERIWRPRYIDPEKEYTYVNLDGNRAVDLGLRPRPQDKHITDTVAVMAIGYPCGDWFTPRNNRYGGVTYCCDYVDSIRLTPGFSPRGYYLNTYQRDDEKRIKVFVGLPTDSADVIMDCCISPLMDFIVPEGMLGRYIAAGLPADRTSVDTEGVLGITAVSPDTAAGRRGTYTLDGRRIPHGVTPAPGIYIIDGRKVVTGRRQ